MIRAGCAAFACGVYLVSLGLLAPATLIDQHLEQATGGRLRLTGASGTVWSGTGVLELRHAGKRLGNGHRIDWRLRPLSLLRGAPVYDTHWVARKDVVIVRPGVARVGIENLEATLPASALALVMPRLAALDLSGTLQLRIDSLELGQSTLSGKARLAWSLAGSALTPVHPLGDYELRVNGSESKVSVTLHTLQGPLNLQGEGTWAQGAPPTFFATARAPKPLDRQLAPVLRLIGTERRDGSFELLLK